MNTSSTSTTHCFTLQQLRAATQAGGVANVALKAQGSGFYIQIQLRTEQQAVLVTARSRAPRMFKNPAQAFGVLKRIGIVTGHFDMSHYVPEQHATTAKKTTAVATPPIKASQAAAPTPAPAKPVSKPTTKPTPKPTPASTSSVVAPKPKATTTAADTDSALGVQQSLI